MTALLPYLAIDSGTSGCVELVNNARTLSYIGRATAPRPAGTWRLTDLAECQMCPEFDAGDYTWPHDFQANPAPWADPARPASWEFFGLLLDGGSMILESSWSSRRRGSSLLDQQTYSPRTLTITGTIVSSSQRGTVYGEEWIARMLRGLGCSPGRSQVFTARVLKHCPDENASEFTQWQPLPTQASTAAIPLLWEDGEPVLWEDGTPVLWESAVIKGVDPCGDIYDVDPLEPVPADYIPPYLPDPGWRELFRCRFVSIDDLDDEPMDPCEGKRVAIVIEVLGDGAWFPAEDAYGYSTLVDGAFDEEMARVFEVPEGRPILEAASCGVCGLPCRCSDTAVQVDTWPMALEGCYREPLVDVPVAVLTPILPWSTDAAMVVGIEGGAGGLENVSVRVYEALDGIPNPVTVLGCRIYSEREPCAEALIAGVSPGATLTLDGRTGRTTLLCPGRDPEPGEGLALGREGRPFAHPRLSCGRRFWIVVAADYYHLSADASVRVRYVPFEVA